AKPGFPGSEWTIVPQPSLPTREATDPHALPLPPAPPREGSRPALSDDEVVRRVLAGDVASVELILRRYNQRLFRVARGIVGDDSSAEDVVQEAYLRAFEHLSQFEGRASFATWLTRIAVHGALASRRERNRMLPLDPRDADGLD